MEQILQVDKKLVAVTERGLLAVRKKLGLSHPAAMAWAGTITIFLLALSTFLGTGSLIFTKLPLLFLYAVLAYVMGRTIFRQLQFFHENWSADSERILTNISMANRRNLWPLRLGFAAASIFFVTMAVMVSTNLHALGAITYGQAVLNVFCSLIGLPILLLYQYVQCARPNGDGGR
jgi:hypothetical protein